MIFRKYDQEKYSTFFPGLPKVEGTSGSSILLCYHFFFPFLALRLALIQSKYLGNKSETLVRVKELIQQAAENKAQLICLPVSL